MPWFFAGLLIGTVCWAVYDMTTLVVRVRAAYRKGYRRAQNGRPFYMENGEEGWRDSEY